MVGACHIPPDYFNDEMDMLQVSAVMDQYNEAYRDSWEQTRFSCFITAKAAGSKKLNKPSDLMEFEWEKKARPKPRKLTPEQLKEMTANYTESLNNFKEGKGEIWRPDLK